MENWNTKLQQIRAKYPLQLPKILRNLKQIRWIKGDKTECIADLHEVRSLFPRTFGREILTPSKGESNSHQPLKIGVVFSGGQAPGGHNVICGLYQALSFLHPESVLVGFLDGPKGILENRYISLTQNKIDFYRNQGGFDLLGSGRTKIETSQQFNNCLKTIQIHRLDGIVIIGGDDSNTNAALLAEYFLEKKEKICVIGVPKTIDGDLKTNFFATSFGFDTATKTYAEMIGNIARDASSAKKYWHFIKLMGRAASHVTLECALVTHPNLAFIGEEIAAQKKSLGQILEELSNLILQRSELGKEYGVILIPEGLLEFIPEVKTLMQELQKIISETENPTIETIPSILSYSSMKCWEQFPKDIQQQLLLERDSHGNIQLSKIETEKFLLSAIQRRLIKKHVHFSPQSHFFGYEGRSAYPSLFDSHYSYALGHVAALLIAQQVTGYLACVGNLHLPIEDWSILGVPLTMLMHMEERSGKRKPVIQKTLVDLNGKPFHFFSKIRKNWDLTDSYVSPGPIQFMGEFENLNMSPLTIQLENNMNI